MPSSLEWRLRRFHALYEVICAGIDGNLSAVGAAALDLVVEKLNANITGTSDHPKEVLIKGIWHDGATLSARIKSPHSKDLPR